MNRRLIICAGALCGIIASLGLMSPVNAATLPLQSRLGGLAFYDPNLDITWAADASLSGTGTWDDQMAWAAGLTIGGLSGWRLASADVNGDGTFAECSVSSIGCEDDELSFLFWEEGISTIAQNPFSNIQSSDYWSSTDCCGGSFALIFNFVDGDDSQATNKNLVPKYGWAVRDGDVIPIPAAVWLFGSALGLLGWLKRKTP